MRILAVDDDPIMLDLLEMTLVAGGVCTLTRATSAAEAMERIDAAEAPFEALLLDVMMEGRDGILLCEEIRGLPDYVSTPILIITASREAGLMERAFAAGATDYISKPLDGLELGTRINLARMLNQSMKREKASKRRLAELRRTAFDAAFVVPGLVGAVEALALENAMLRLPKGLYPMALISVGIADAQAVHETSASEEWHDNIAAVGAALLQALPSGTTRFAHIGHGRWVVVVHGRRGPNAASLMAALTAILEGEGTEIAVTVEPIDPRSIWSGEAAATALADFRAKVAPLPQTGLAPEARAAAAGQSPEMAEPDDLAPIALDGPAVVETAGAAAPSPVRPSRPVRPGRPGRPGRHAASPEAPSFDLDAALKAAVRVEVLDEDDGTAVRSEAHGAQTERPVARPATQPLAQPATRPAPGTEVALRRETGMVPASAAPAFEDEDEDADAEDGADIAARVARRFSQQGFDSRPSVTFPEPADEPALFETASRLFEAREKRKQEMLARVTLQG